MPRDALLPSPASPAPIRRPVPRQFLERVSRALLVRLLAPHQALLAARAFPVDALAASAQTDRAHVEALWSLLGDAPPELVVLRDELLAVADTATPWGHELLLAQDTARALDHELGAEDCAATARLDHPSLFDRARPQTAGQAQTRSFASFQASVPAPLPEDSSCHAGFDARMRDELAARGRSSYFKRHAWQSGTERHFELVYGKLASARDLIGKTSGGAAHDVTAQVTDRSTERAHAVFHDDTLRLDVAGYDWMKELVRRLFGEAYFGSSAHFEGQEVLTLAPLEDLAAALSVEGVPGLSKVVLNQVEVDLGGDAAWVAVGARNDVMTQASAGFALRALSEGRSSVATFLLYTTWRKRPFTLKMTPPRRLEYDRRDPRFAQAVRDWTIARGFLSLPDHLNMRASGVPGALEDESERTGS